MIQPVPEKLTDHVRLDIIHAQRFAIISSSNVREQGYCLRRSSLVQKMPSGSGKWRSVGWIQKLSRSERRLVVIGSAVGLNVNLCSAGYISSARTLLMNTTTTLGLACRKLNASYLLFFPSRSSASTGQTEIQAAERATRDKECDGTRSRCFV
jgi:hypothetical protein